ncbi:MAG: DedA family protein [Cyanosarcina radialis HA8281-LM2]|jgi:membrane protein DedA with SNARE-associated domain|nr:DedA family protein [Cyanosarcina radialis HA8281-LM2]
MSLEFVSLEKIQEIARDFGYLAVFLGVLLENVGLPLPGETFTIVGGFLAGSGELNYWFLLGDAILSAFIGATCGYAIGRYGGWQMLLKIGQFFRLPEVRLVELKDKFSDNASKAVFFGRFVAFLRMFVGLMAGIVQMPFGQFLGFNIAGATVWASVMVTVSFFIGRIVSLEQLVSWAAQFALVALVIAIAAIGIPLWLESRQTKRSVEKD